MIDLGEVMLCPKSLHESCRMGRRVVMMKLICLLGHSKYEGHTVHRLSQRCLTADWLAPRENACSRMHSKVSSDWLPSYIKVTRPVLEIFKMDGYFPDSPRIARPKSDRRYLGCVVIVVMVWVIRCQTLSEHLWTIWSCCLYVFYGYYYHNIFDMDMFYARIRTASLTSYPVRCKILHQRTAPLS
jgi:hypothetical protein